MRFHCFRIAALLALTLVVSLVLNRDAPADAEPSTARLAKKISNVTFTDDANKTLSLYDMKDKKAIVVVFLSFDCPVSTSYSQPLADLAKAYADKGVAFVGVCPCDDDAKAVAKNAKDFKLPFPVYKDANPSAVTAFQADYTPEAFVMDGQHVLRYRGRIDDLYVARLKKKNTITRNDLKQALDELLDGKDVSQPATLAIGCPIPKNTTAKPATGKVTYYKDVVGILQKNCQSCHRPGDVGPFSLMTYKQAVNWAADIKDYTQSKKMPPWKPSEGAGFRDERTMTAEEIATLAAWVDGGTPEGDPKDAPPPRKLTEGWQLGQPDLVLTVNDDFHLGASGRDLFRCFVLPTNLDEDKFVTAVDVRPGNPRVVHHTLNFIDTQGRARKMEAAAKEKAGKDDKDHGPGYTVQMGVGFAPSGALGGWAPGHVARHLPEDTGFHLPKGSDVVIQTHYHRNGRLEKDRLQIGLYFAPKPVSKRFQSLVVAGRFLFIPAGAEDYKVKGSMWVDQDCVVHSVLPHMHMLGKQIKVTMTPPEGETKALVAIKDWDYNWQETYFFKEPMAVKSGTRFDIEAVYDNSAKNPRNPFNPPKLVHLGEQTTDEMCFGFIGATSDKPGRIRQLRTEPPKPAK
ncbi:MAG: redoxin domain-containing protein [Gemmataceae bacterium]|nr:redoxin domain-containing protein [Gemmataceae bacterium]